MTDSDNGLAKHVLNKALELHSKKEGDYREILGVDDIQEVASELGIAKEYILESLKEPQIKAQTSEEPTLFLSRRYIMADAERVRRAIKPYLSKHEGLTISGVIPNGFDLKPLGAIDSLMSMKSKEEIPLTEFEKLKIIITPVDEGSCIVSLQAKVFHKDVPIIISAGTGVMIGGTVPLALPIDEWSVLLYATLAGVGAVTFGGAGWYLGRQWLGHWIDETTSKFSRALNGIGLQVENPELSAPSAIETRAKNASQYIRGFIKGLTGRDND